LKSLHRFPDKSGQVPDKSGQVVLADFEQQFIPALAIASSGRIIIKKTFHHKY